ncbi:MAG TPA: SUMF1/EgtB/PvdO family nonheme iron enzyme [Myxococcota bacterium]|nr:SUMF1/EgtB/PvdO family nonheme iron enzyme [Myxococcota bacterium]
MTRLQLEYPTGEIIASKYEVVERLDRSPLGVSYRVRHDKSGRTLRLLMLDPEVAGKDAKERIIEAVKTAKAISDPGLLKVGELGQHNGVAYITTEDFAGRTLRELLQENRVKGAQLSPQEVAQITVKLLEACRAVHDAGHQLRALRPEYVLVSLRRTGPKGATVVAEVRVLHAGLWDLVPIGVLAEDEFNRGEAQYLAPELKSFNPKTTARADVYSAGVIFYELLVGQAPLGTYQFPRQRRPELPELVDNICEMALASAPEDRYPTVRDFIVSVQSTFRSVEEDEIPIRTGMHPLVWVLGGVIVVALSVMLYFGTADSQLQLVARDNDLRSGILEKHSRPEASRLTEILAKAPPNMAYIPAGPFVSGRLHQEADNLGAEPLAEVRELPAYLIDIFEAPNLKDAPPTVGVTLAEAEKACQAQSKRLCSADELEKACKGPANLIYGYDDAYSAAACGSDSTKAYTSGSRADCKSGWGVYDLAGNLREWTSTRTGDTRALLKGGVDSNPQKSTRCAFSSDEGTAFADGTIGFRCCADAPKEP